MRLAPRGVSGGVSYSGWMVPAPTELLGLLAEPARLSVVAALVLGARTTAEIVEMTRLDAPTVLRALARLDGSGLVTSAGSGWKLHRELFTEAARTAAPDPPEQDFGTSDPATASVLRAFLRDGRLTSIPAARSKRLVVLDHVARVFEPGVRYPEDAVSAVLRAFHPDYAALRRYLVDEGFLSRESGVYWRSGGTVEF